MAAPGNRLLLAPGARGGNRPAAREPYDLDPEEVLRLFVPKAHEIDQKKDPRLWHLAGHLAEAFSVHAAATYVMEKDPDWDFSAIYYRPLDEICHRFMHYHPPRMEGVPEKDFALYRDVVHATYRLYDLFLRRLLHFAGPDGAVMVVSDHGFHSDHLRPRFTPNVPAGITVWHRPQGIFAARGPGFRADELVFGARLLDVAQTILSYFGLPAGRDMDGRVLEEAFIERRPPDLVDTWEDPGGIERQDSIIIFQQHHTLGSRVPGEFFVRIGLHIRADEAGGAVIEQANAEHGGQDPQHHIVQATHRHLACVDRRLERYIVGPARHFHIQTAQRGIE